MSVNLSDIFDFIILKLAYLYVNQNSSNKVNDINIIVSNFNTNNNFDKIKVNLYPYVITMGNGHKVQLLKAFDENFYYTSFGIFHKEFFNIVSNQSTNNIIFSFNSDSIVLNLKPNIILHFANNNDFETYLINYFATSPNSQAIDFINKSINSIIKNWSNEFIFGDKTKLLLLNKKNTAFLNLEKKIKNNHSYSEKRKYEEVFNDKVKYDRSVLEIA